MYMYFYICMLIYVYNIIDLCLCALKSKALHILSRKIHKYKKLSLLLSGNLWIPQTVGLLIKGSLI